MRASGGIGSFFRRQGAPVTIGLICGIVGISVLLFLFHYSGEALILYGDTVAKPWVYVPYAFVNDLSSGFGVIGMLFAAYWLFWVGGATERDLGSLRFGILWVVASVLGGGCVAIAGQLVHAQLWMAIGALLPVSVLTVIWGTRNRTATVMLMACIPMSGFWLSWLSVAIVFVEFGRVNLAIGAAACLPLALGWAYAANRIPGLTYGKPASVYKPSKAQREKEAAFFDDIRAREQERADRERLRKLFEGSINDEQ